MFFCQTRTRPGSWRHGAPALMFAPSAFSCCLRGPSSWSLSVDLSLTTGGTCSIQAWKGSTSRHENRIERGIGPMKTGAEGVTRILCCRVPVVIGECTGVLERLLTLRGGLEAWASTRNRCRRLGSPLVIALLPPTVQGRREGTWRIPAIFRGSSTGAMRPLRPWTCRSLAGRVLWDLSPRTRRRQGVGLHCPRRARGSTRTRGWEMMEGQGSLRGAG